MIELNSFHDLGPVPKPSSVMPAPNVRLTLSRLATYKAVIEHHGLRSAAAQIGISQPAVSRHMHLMDRYFGARLTRREGNTTLPTAAGAEVYKLALDTIAQVRRLQECITLEATGHYVSVSIGSSAHVGSYYLSSVLAEFRQDHPEADLQLHVSNRESLLRHVVAGTMALAYVPAGPVPLELVSEFVHSQPIVFVANPNHPLAHQEHISFKRLQAYEVATCMSSSESGIHYGRVARRLIDDTEHGSGWRLRAVGTPEGVKFTLAVSDAIAFLPWCDVTREIENGALVRLDAVCDIRQRYALVWRRESPPTPLLDQFLALVRRTPLCPTNS